MQTRIVHTVLTILKTHTRQRFRLSTKNVSYSIKNYSEVQRLTVLLAGLIKIGSYGIPSHFPHHIRNDEI